MRTPSVVFAVALSSICSLAATALTSIWKPPEAPDLIRNTPIEYLNRGVVRIVAYWSDPEGGSLAHQERGTGIILGYGRSDMNVMTAAHVVHGARIGSADLIRVSFMDNPTYANTAAILHLDSERDFAVLRVEGWLDERERRASIKIPVDMRFDAMRGGSLT